MKAFGRKKLRRKPNAALQKHLESQGHHPECSCWTGPICDCKGLPFNVLEPDGWEHICYRNGCAPPTSTQPAVSDFDRLLSACKQWKQATESRLKMLDSRGEAAKAMLKPDADLIAVIEELDRG